MTWRNVTTGEFYRGGSLKTKDGTIFNPTEETLRKYGYEVYVAPQVEAVKVEPSDARQQAYEVEVDPLVNKRNSYQIEADYYYPLSIKARNDGDTEAHAKYVAMYNHAKEMYDALTVEICEKKQEIRERYPDEVK